MTNRKEAQLALDLRRGRTKSYELAACGILPIALNNAIELCDLPGVHAVLVYLFRDEGSRDTFAYSTDVTGRNIPRASRYTQWSFEAAEKIQDLRDFEEVIEHLKQKGFYIFRRSRAS